MSSCLPCMSSSILWCQTGWTEPSNLTRTSLLAQQKIEWPVSLHWGWWQNDWKRRTLDTLSQQFFHAERSDARSMEEHQQVSRIFSQHLLPKKNHVRKSDFKSIKASSSCFGRDVCTPIQIFFQYVGINFLVLSRLKDIRENPKAIRMGNYHSLVFDCIVTISPINLILRHPLTKWPFSVLSLQLFYKLC